MELHKAKPVVFVGTRHVEYTYILALLVGLVVTYSVAAQSFVRISTYPVGNGPNNVTVVDVNGDGCLDLVCANDGNSFDGNTLTVLTNSGSGVFGFNAIYAVGKAPFVVAADLRGNGHQDLIAANFASSTVLVLTNNGFGVFGSNATYVVGNGPFNVVAVDINNDGRPDLVTANDGTSFDGNTLTVLTNNGNGMFGSNATYTVGYLPSITAADLRGTGRPDLITANYNDDSLSVLTNNGSGIFGLNSTYDLASGSGPINVVAANVNGDNRLDLICANSTTNTLTVLTNKGDGKFAVSALLSVAAAPYYVASADVNGDGKLDLITANIDEASLTVLTNNGNGIFASNATYNVGSGPISITAADINNDGRQELVSVNFDDDTLTVRLELPMLDLKFANHSATVSWPPNWTGYILQQNTNLSPFSWSEASNPTGTNRLTFPTEVGNYFYRLFHQ